MPTNSAVKYPKRCKYVKKFSKCSQISKPIQTIDCSKYSKYRNKWDKGDLKCQKCDQIGKSGQKQSFKSISNGAGHFFLNQIPMSAFWRHVDVIAVILRFRNRVKSPKSFYLIINLCWKKNCVPKSEFVSKSSTCIEWKWSQKTAFDKRCTSIRVKLNKVITRRHCIMFSIDLRLSVCQYVQFVHWPRNNLVQIEENGKREPATVVRVVLIEICCLVC